MDQQPSNGFFYLLFLPLLLVCMFSYYASAHSQEINQPLATAPAESKVWGNDRAAARPAPSFFRLRARLAAADRNRALEALHLALSQVGDGGSYVWARPKKRLRGIITLTASFRDVQGRICRHIIYKLVLGEHSRRTEGIACRGKNRQWELAG